MEVLLAVFVTRICINNLIPSSSLCFQPGVMLKPNKLQSGNTTHGKCGVASGLRDWTMMHFPCGGELHRKVELMQKYWNEVLDAT